MTARSKVTEIGGKIRHTIPYHAIYCTSVGPERVDSNSLTSIYGCRKEETSEGRGKSVVCERKGIGLREFAFNPS